MKLQEIKEYYADYRTNPPLKNHYFIDSKNRKHGPYMFYSRVGQLISERHFNADTLHGTYKMFSHGIDNKINGFWSYKMGIRFGQHKF